MIFTGNITFLALSLLSEPILCFNNFVKSIYNIGVNNFVKIIYNI